MSGVLSNANSDASETGQPDDSDGSLTGYLRTVFGRLHRRLVARLRTDDRDDADQTHAARGGDSPRCIGSDRFPDRSYPLTYPGRDLAEINSTDVVGFETEEGLRLSVPENADATIVSDQWVPIER